MISSLFLNRYTIALAAAAGVVTLVGFAYNSHRNTLIQSGYDKAMGEMREFNADTLREYQKERSRQQTALILLQEKYVKSTLQVADFGKRNLDAERMLRDQKSDFEQRLKRANSDSVRQYATDITSNLERCRGDVTRFAQEAASCSDVAYTLKDTLDVILKK